MFSFGQHLPSQDSTAIISYSDKFIIKLNVDTQTDRYFVNDIATNTNLTIAPNANLRIALSLDYEFIGASIGFSPKFLPGNDDDGLKGKSSFTEYSFRFFLGNWSQGLIYSNIQGYFVENTKDFIPGWIENTDPYIQFPNLKTIRWGGSTSYIFNNKFSLRNVVYQTEWQRKSAGSFVPKLDYHFNRFSYKVDGLKSVENAFDVLVAPSYHYTWVIHKNWFVSTFIAPAVGIRFSTSKEEEGNGMTVTEKNQHFIQAIDSGLQLGFSSRKTIFGIQLNVDANWYNEDKTTNIVDDKLYAKLYVGYRFNAPKAVRKIFRSNQKD